jgi:choline dehydrogenase-like flavoprotein
MSSKREYDAIVIGSGMGGLAFASIMAKLRKWRVLVLERHFKDRRFHTHFHTAGRLVLGCRASLCGRDGRRHDGSPAV